VAYPSGSDNKETPPGGNPPSNLAQVSDQLIFQYYQRVLRMMNAYRNNRVYGSEDFKDMYLHNIVPVDRFLSQLSMSHNLHFCSPLLYCE